MVVAAAGLSLAEALRTGSHKAIILDYLDRRGEGERAVRVVGLARACSKVSSGIAALVGGLILAGFETYELLFELSMLPALAGFVLMLSHPRYLDGEQSRLRRGSGGPERPSLGQAARALLAARDTRFLLVESVLFETQAKLVLKYYLQPFL